MPHAHDPRLRRLRTALSPDGHVAELDEQPDSAVERMEAAVSLIVRPGERLDLLLIKRAEHEGDPWSGQMALPGGRWEPGDSGLLRTAKRETFEETGVDLELLGTPLGRLPDVEPASPRLPPMRIVPYVFAVPAETVAEVTSVELASVHWVAVDLLGHPDTASNTRIHFTGFSKVFPSFHVEGEHVWGLTHRILTAFLEATRPTPR